MKSRKATTPSYGMALYRLARIPPTERCPFKFNRPAAVASARKAASRAASPVTNGMLVKERAAGATGLLKRRDCAKKSYRTWALRVFSAAIAATPPWS